jgi:predicted nucleic acid-binding protein
VRATADTSILCYLILIEEARLLPALFTEVAIPPAVRDELAHPDAPEKVRSWIASPPPWLTVEGVAASGDDPEIERLDPGERECILLARQAGSGVLLLDDWKAREVARERGLPLTGLIGVLDMAIKKGLVDPVSVVERLQATSFRVSRQLLAPLLLP